MYPFNDNDAFAVQNAWYIAGFSNEITRKPLERWFLNKPVVMFRKEDGSLAAVAGRCPHRHFPMAAGYLEGDNIVCSYHGISFATDGKCTNIPTQKNVPPSYCIETYPIAERWQFVWIWMGDPKLADEALIPDHDKLGIGKEGYVTHQVCYNYVEGRYQLLHDNLLDLSHVGFLHAANIGSKEIAETHCDVETGENWVRTKRDILDFQAGPEFKDLIGDKHIDFYIDFTFHAPCLHAGKNKITLAGEDVSKPENRIIDAIVYHAITPAEKYTCHYFFAISYCNPERAPSLEQSIEINCRVIDEDKFATIEIERMIKNDEKLRDRLTAGDTGVVAGRVLLQNMIKKEKLS